MSKTDYNYRIQDIITVDKHKYRIAAIYNSIVKGINMCVLVLTWHTVGEEAIA